MRLETIHMVGPPTNSPMSLTFEECLGLSALQVLSRIEQEAARKVRLPLQIDKTAIHHYLLLHGLRLNKVALDSIFAKIQFHFPTLIDIGKKYVKIHSTTMNSQHLIKATFACLSLKSPYITRPHLHTFSLMFREILEETKVQAMMDCECPCHYLKEFTESSQGRDIFTTKKLRQQQREIILEQREPENFQIRKHRTRGRCVHAKKFYEKGEPIVEYKGKILTNDEAIRLHRTLKSDPNKGSFIAWFPWKEKMIAVDATEEVDNENGRLLNHARGGRKENCKATVIDYQKEPRVLLVANRVILPGEELCWDYGERNQEVLKDLPWLKKNFEKNSQEECCEFDKQQAMNCSILRDIYCQDASLPCIEAVHEYSYQRNMAIMAEEESHKYYKLHRKHKKLIDKRRSSNRSMIKKRENVRKPFKTFFSQYHKKEECKMIQIANTHNAKNIFLTGYNLCLMNELDKSEREDSKFLRFFALKTQEPSFNKLRVFSSEPLARLSDLQTTFFQSKHPISEF